MFLLIIVLQRPQSLPSWQCFGCSSQQSEPVLVLVCLSLNSKYSSPSAFSFNLTSPQQMSLCYLQTLSPKYMVLLNQSVFISLQDFVYRGSLFRGAYSIHPKRLAYFLFLFSSTLSVSGQDFPCFLKYEVNHDTGRVAVLL